MKATHKNLGLSACLVSASGSLFRFICSCHGLEAGFPKIRILSLPLWFAAAVTWPFTVTIFFLYTTILSEDRVGLSEVTGAMAAINYLLVTLASMNAFIRNRKKVEGLLRGEATTVLDVFVPLLCSIPLLVTCLSLLCRVGSLPMIMGYANYIAFKLSATAFSMIYASIGSSIVLQLAKLDKLNRTRDVSWNYLLSEKFRIRKEIETVNSVFALPLTLHYSLLILGVTSDVADAMSSTLRYFEKILLLISSFTYLVSMAYGAYKGSLIMSQSVNTEFYIWTLVISRADERNSDRQWEAIGAFRFREEWDTLRVACFTSKLGNFILFLSASFTCVAVVLQFDYKVARYISSLTNSAP